ncbi:DUF1353 domain-containing protein [Cognatishimia sp. F0-27]|uniref:DUF1353 domain-containing protein n=1 Tax=Cognatishimia sp. F0-27 TaxID=2816855 RepID=UPI001D0CB2E5|nr:DUF1353 domain-containing protein [Cognatishimia sp. F0-27]MCC1491734.1 DUF1353 domain-containing protein [Cognatishimia sp. F0-27]
MAAGLVAIGALAYAVPELIAMRSTNSAETCLTLEDPGPRCKFSGTPLEMAGTPVFVEKFKHAFMPTTKPLSFIDARGMDWTAPPKTLTDGASIPSVFEPLVGDRQSREYLLAAALHDAYTGVGNEQLETYQTRRWQDVHAMFYDALLVAGTPPTRAKLLYAAVYLGGPRWNDPDRMLDAVSEAALLQEMRWCLDWIRAEDPPRSEIDAWMETREEALRTGTNTRPDYFKGLPSGL